MNNKTETLSDRLSRAIEHTGKKKIELARALNVSPQVINRLCNGTTTATRFAADLANELNINLEWLVTGHGVMLKNGDARKKFYNSCTAIPVIAPTQLKDYLKQEKHKESATEFIFMKKKNIYALATIMSDVSMEMLIRKNSIVVFDTHAKELIINDIAFMLKKLMNI